MVGGVSTKSASQASAIRDPDPTPKDNKGYLPPTAATAPVVVHTINGKCVSAGAGIADGVVEGRAALAVAARTGPAVGPAAVREIERRVVRLALAVVFLAVRLAAVIVARATIAVFAVSRRKKKWLD